MARCWLKGLAAAVATAALLTMAAGPLSAQLGSSAPAQARIPLVLVHGLTCGGASVWGGRTGSPASGRGSESRGLYRLLLGAGYEPDHTLFTYDYDNPPSSDYAVLGEVGLDAVVREALAVAGTERVDLLTFGSGSLVARYWISTHPAGSAPVRNLVMIAPPNHGQFQVDLLKVLYHLDHLLKRGGSAAGGGASSGEPPGGPPPFTDEDTYVGSRARDYLDLYGDYVLETRLLGGAGTLGAASTTSAAARPSGAVVPGYEDWLLSKRPEVANHFIFGAETIPDPPGLGLTLAYYDILSLRVGRQLYLAGVVARGKAPPLPSLEDLLSENWRREVTTYLKDLLRDWGLPEAKRLLAEHGSGVALELGEMLTSLSPEVPAISRLVPEYLAFPFPGGTPCRTEPPARPVLCNGFLHGWEGREAAARPADSRYVVIAGETPSPLGLVGRDIGPNDATVEVASAVTAPAAADELLVGRGTRWAHGLLPGNEKLAGWVLAILDPGDRGESTADGVAGGVVERLDLSGPGRESGTGTASLWHPAYVVLPAGSAGEDGENAAGQEKTAEVAVEIRVGDPGASGLEGLTALAWLAETGGGSGDWVGGDIPLPVASFVLVPDPESRAGLSLTGVARASSPTPGSRLVLGVRLVPKEAGDYLVMGRYLGLDPQVPFSYRFFDSVSQEASVSPEVPIDTDAGQDVGRDGSSAGEGSASGGGKGGAGDETSSGQTGEPGGTPGVDPGSGSGSPTGSSDGGAGRGQAELVPTPKPPLIKVVRVTKLTADKREDRTYHARWEWEFGDGERLSDVDPSHTKVTVSHTYQAAGPYQVTATSLANDGRVLRKLQWSVEVGGGAAAPGSESLTATFEAETIVEPVVVLTLEGPQKWVTGKPARFTLKADISWPPRTRRQVVKAYPGWEFDVVWEKPGAFEVRAAVTVRQSYEFPDQRLTVYNTYVTVVTVEVLTPGLTE